MVDNSEQALLARRDFLINKIQSSGSQYKNKDVQDLNEIQTKLRNTYKYRYSQSPNFNVSSKGVLSAQQSAFGPTAFNTPSSYNPNAELEAQTGYKIEEDAVPFSEQVKNINQNKKQNENNASTNPNFAFQGLNPVASYQGGGEIYQNQYGQQFVTRKSQVGSNIQRFDVEPYNAPPTIKSFEKLTPFEKFKFANQLVISQYGGPQVVEAGINTVKFYENQTYAYEDNINLSGEVVARTRYGTISSRPDVNLYASLKTLGSDIAFTYPDVNQRVYGRSPVYRGLSFATNAGFELGTFTTQGIPVVRDIYSSTRNVAQPFVQSAVENPVYAYVAVRGPKILGNRAYAVLDYLDVGQSVVTESARGYATGGIPGAIKGGTGAYIGERLSDKTAFFAGSPKLSNPVYSLTTKGQPTPMVLNQIAPNQYEVLMQYKPQYVRGTTFKEIKGLGTVQERFKTTKRPAEIDADGLYYPTTEPPQPATVVYSRKLVSLTPTQRKPFEWGKRAQLSMSSLTGGNGADNFRGTENYQDTMRPAEPEIVSIVKTRISPINEINNRTRPKETVLQRSISPTVSTTLSRTKTLPRSLTYNLNINKNLSKPSSNTRNISTTLSQTLPLSLSVTNTVTETQSQTMTESMSRTFARTQTQTQTLTKTQTRTQTQTPTITRNKFRKIADISKKAKTYIPKSRNRTYAYKTSLFAYTNRIKGKRSKIGTVSGLGIRPQ